MSNHRDKRPKGFKGASGTDQTAFLSYDDGLIDIGNRLLIADSLLRLVSKKMSVKNFMRELLLVAMSAIKANAGSVLEVEYGSGVLFFRAVVGQGAEAVEQFSLPLGQGIAGFVAESKQAFIENSLKTNPQHLSAVSKAVGFEANNIIAAPIIIRGKTIEVVELLNRVGKEGFTQQDLDLLIYFCEMAAIAIEVRYTLGFSSGSKKSPNNKANAA